MKVLYKVGLTAESRVKTLQNKKIQGIYVEMMEKKSLTCNNPRW